VVGVGSAVVGASVLVVGVSPSVPVAVEELPGLAEQPARPSASAATTERLEGMSDSTGSTDISFL